MSSLASMPTPCVLVVEDEQRLRDLLIRAVEQLGYVATGSGTAEHALTLFQEQPCQIALLDLILPGMTGMELFQKLRATYPHLQVIILTGFGDLDAAKQAIHLDVVEFLTKPAHLGDLEKALDKAHRRLAKIHAKQIGTDIVELLKEPAKPSIPVPDSGESPTNLKDLERKHILDTLARHNGNRESAAEELGISIRKLYYRLDEYRKESS